MSIRLLVDKPTTSLTHLCENCRYARRMAGPGTEHYFCRALGCELKHMVTECSAYEAKSQNHESMLVGKLKQEAYSLIRMEGELYFLSPEEWQRWDYANDNNLPFTLDRNR